MDSFSQQVVFFRLSRWLRRSVVLSVPRRQRRKRWPRQRQQRPLPRPHPSRQRSASRPAKRRVARRKRASRQGRRRPSHPRRPPRRPPEARRARNAGAKLPPPLPTELTATYRTVALTPRAFHQLVMALVRTTFSISVSSSPASRTNCLPLYDRSSCRQF